MIKKNGFKFLILTFLLFFIPVSVSHGSSVSRTEPVLNRIREYDERFEDINGKWFYENVKTLYEVGLTEGNSRNTYSPNKNLTLAEAITFTARVKACNRVDMDSIIPDVNKWYGQAVKYLQDQGVIGREFEGQYERYATRSELAYILSRAVHLEEINDISYLDIPDVSSRTPNGADVLKLYRAGILTGSSNLTFDGDRNVTRGETSAMLSRVIDKNLRLNIQGRQSTNKSLYVSKHQNNGQYASPTMNKHSHPRFNTKNDSLIRGIKYGWHTYGSNNQAEYDFVLDIVEEATILAKRNSRGILPINVTGDFRSDEAAVRRVVEGKGSKNDEKIVQGMLDKIDKNGEYREVKKLPIRDQGKVVIQYLELNRAFNYLRTENNPSYVTDNNRIDTAFDYLNRDRLALCQARMSIWLAISDTLGYDAKGVQTAPDHIEAFILYGNTWISKGHNFVTTSFPFDIDGFRTITRVQKTSDTTVLDGHVY